LLILVAMAEESCILRDTNNGPHGGQNGPTK